MSKALLRCVGYKPVCRGTLWGFASIAFSNLKVTVRGGDCACRQDVEVERENPLQFGTDSDAKPAFKNGGRQ
jgi:hypothetical protein